jgi:hypothetical protein
MRDVEVSLLKEQVMVWWSNVNMRPFKLLTVLGQCRREGPGTVEDLRQQPTCSGRDMLYDEDHSGKIVRELHHELQ